MSLRTASGRLGKLAQATDPPSPFGDASNDGFCVNIQTEISSTIAHDRLLRCGSAFWYSHQARA